MNKNTKSLINLTIILSCSISCFAQSIINVNGVNYLINNGAALIGRQNPDLSGEVVIPSTIIYEGNSYTVNGIISPTATHTYGGMSSISAEGAAFQGTSITSITLPSTITSINTCAFINCSQLKKVVLPETIRSIGWGAFAYCSSLSEINIPNSLQSFSTWSFGGCSSLKSISIPQNITSFPESVFKNCGFESFDIPDNITSLGKNCLNMYSLNTVKSYIRDITRISYHEECFGNVTNKTLFVPNGSKYIYQEYFPWRKFATIEEFDDGHTGEPINPLEVIATINNVRYKVSDNGTAIIIQQDESLSGDIVIPEYINVGNTSYTVIGIKSPSDTHSYGGMSSISADGAAFQGTSITSITLPSTITSINTCAFINCSQLKKVVLPETIRSIGWGAFAYCSSLSEINIPNSLQSFSTWSFGGCSSLKNISIPQNITSFPESVFRNCGFESFDIPDNITSLGKNCLNMYSLNTVKSYIRDITRISYHEECFGDVTNKTLFVPNGSKFIYQEYFPWRKFASIEEFDDGHTGEPIDPLEVIATVDNVRYTVYENGTAIIIQQDESLSGDIVIPDIISVGYKSYAVVGIKAPSDTHSWGGNSSISADGAAFQGTSITSISLPSTLTNINTCAFINCSKLKKVVLPETIKSIGWGAFAYCSSLSEINIPNSLQSISAWSFAGCLQLKQINLPKQIRSFPLACFKGSGLTSIDIHENINHIENLALNMSSLCYVKIYQTNVNSLSTSENAFGSYDNIQNTKLLVPRGCKSDYIQIYPWIYFNSVEEFGYLINTNNSEGGTLTASRSVVLYDDDEVRFEISPISGYVLESLTINGTNVTSDVIDGEYVIREIREDIDAVAIFERIIGREDVNGDGEINIADINTIIDSILNDKFINSYDLNADGEVNIADINSIINYILSN